jgi:hypothetical protein
MAKATPEALIKKSPKRNSGQQPNLIVARDTSRLKLYCAKGHHGHVTNMAKLVKSANSGLRFLHSFGKALHERRQCFAPMAPALGLPPPRPGSV